MSKIVTRVPVGFGINAFVPPLPSWHMQASQAGSGDSAVVAKVTLPEPGTWRLFLQMKLGGRIVTARYTLAVSS